MPKKNEPGTKSIKIMKKAQKRREKIKKRSSSQKERKDKNLEEEKLLNEIAYDLSRKFSYTKLSNAVDSKGSYDVHGYMEKTYLNYEWLITKMVLDRACFYAVKDYIPERIKFVREIDIKNYHRCVIETSVEITLENYPNFPFNKLILYSKEKIDEGINWIDNYPWILEGYDTSIQLGPANLALLGWATWNIPICLLLHAPGRNEAIFQAKTSAKDLKVEKEEIMKNFIYSYRTYINVMEEKIDEREMESMQYQRLYSDLKRTVLSGSPISTADEFARLQQQSIKRAPFKLEKKTVGWIILILIVAILLIWILTSISFPPINQLPPPQDTIPSIFINNWKQVKLKGI